MKKYLVLFCAFTWLVFSVNADLTENALTAVGGLGAADVYITYLAIGSIADAYEKEVYEADDVKTIAEVIVGFCENSQSLLKTLKEEASDEDQEVLQELISIYGNLIKQANALVKYTAAKDSEAGDDFQTYRGKAWAAISELLDLENG